MNPPDMPAIVRGLTIAPEKDAPHLFLHYPAPYGPCIYPGFTDEGSTWTIGAGTAVASKK